MPTTTAELLEAAKQVYAAREPHGCSDKERRTICRIMAMEQRFAFAVHFGHHIRAWLYEVILQTMIEDYIDRYA